MMISVNVFFRKVKNTKALMIKAFLIVICFTFEILIDILNQIYIKVLKNQQITEKVLNNHSFHINDLEIIDKKDLFKSNYQTESLLSVT
jgi:hypothetical protein